MTLLRGGHTKTKKMSTTLNETVRNVKLTEKERKVLSFLNEKLQSYFGEGYSDIDCKDIAEGINEQISTVKGVVGSLVAKKILCTDHIDSGYEVISFILQEYMDYDKFE